jgi:hypothetical protein
MMNIEQQNLEKANEIGRLAKSLTGLPSLDNTERNSSIAFSGKFNTSIMAYGIQRLSEAPAVRETINACKDSFSDSLSTLGEKCKAFFGEVFEKFVTENNNDALALEKFGEEFVEQRDFGLDKCSDAAKEIFNPGVIENWSNLSLSQRKEIAGTYAAEVANAFDLKNYTGVYFEDLDPGVMGYNNGDGSIHLSNDLIASYKSPLEIMDTITHELRHQYQSEAILGYHNVSQEVVKEWSTAQEIYNYDEPYCYDPWGYTYNPLEIDARYAGETVIRNITQEIFNA